MLRTRRAAVPVLHALRREFSNVDVTLYGDKYPSTMDLGNHFYDRLLDKEAIAKRRAENKSMYPPQAVFMEMLPKMGNADGYQFKLYWDGVWGKLPNFPVDPDALLQKFVNEADPDCVIWLMGRAGSKQTYHSNISDFNHWKIVPKMFTGVRTPDLVTNFRMGGHDFSWPTPFAIAPVGVQGRVTYPSEEGDLVAARGAARCGVPFIVSSVSSVSMENIAACIKETAPDGPAPWFQVYNSVVPAVTESMIRRAASSGYGAIVVTADTCKYGFRTEELDGAYFPQADARMTWCQMVWDPVFNDILKTKMGCVAAAEFSENGKYPVDRLKANLAVLGMLGCGLGDTWSKENAVCGRPNDNLDWFKELVQGQLGLPLVVKGIQHPEDAVRCVVKGVDGIVVSNHGGRQTDGSISTIEALPAVVLAVNETCDIKGIPRIPVFLDSGVRYGQHVLKALRLGATGVMVGRMPIVGACLGGTEGVSHVLLSLMSDTQCNMINTGVETIPEVRTKTTLVRSIAVPPPFCQMNGLEPKLQSFVSLS